MVMPTSLSPVQGQEHCEPRPQQAFHAFEKGKSAIDHRGEAFTREGLSRQPIGKPRLVPAIGELRGKENERQAKDCRQKRNVDRHEIRQGEDEKQHSKPAIVESVAEGTQSYPRLAMACHEIAQELRCSPAARRRWDAPLALIRADVVHHTVSCSAPPRKLYAPIMKLDSGA
jgi:hypothetical protein